MHNGEDRHGLNMGVLQSPWVGKLAALFLAFATIFMAATAVNALINFDSISQAPTNVITVSGEGKVSAVPNLATISFSVSENANTASAAQDLATKKSNVALAVLKDLGIEDKDIKTSSYNVYPRYSAQEPCYYYDRGVPCPAGESKIIGYTASQSIDVKVRNIDETGDVLAKLGDAGVSNLYGPNFTIEDQDALVAEARKEAIKKARTQANELASQLGVRIVRIVSYSDGGYPMPYYYGRAEAAMDSSYGKGGSPAPAIPAGENEIVVNVSITYEIR